MTESEWLACGDPQQMLAWLTGYVGIVGGQAVAANYPCPVEPSARKLRLFACACMRRPGAVANRTDYATLEAGEALADGAITQEEAERIADDHYHLGVLVGDEWPIRRAPLAAATELAAGQDWMTAAILRDLIDPFALRARVWSAAKAQGMPDALPWLVREAWVSRQAEVLAESAYRERLPGGQLDPVTLLALADALEEGGCPDGALLRHLRGMEWCIDETHRKGGGVYWCPRCGGSEEGSEGWMDLRGPHWRGCWAVDAILGRC